MTHTKNLADLNAAYAAHCSCALKDTATQAVPGAGSATATVLFVGEAPGKKEDASGVPFVGAAGKVLDELLVSIALKRDDVYITNVVKYRPPDNRDPRPEEVAACWPWLRAQIELIAPQIIVPLGRHALERFVPRQQISKAHGKAFVRDVSDLGTHTFFAMYHPAAAIYNRTLRDTLFADMKKLKKLLQ